MRPRSLARALVLGSVLLVGACTTGSPPLRWDELPLGDNLTPVTLATSGDAVLVGASSPGRPTPRLLRARARSLTEVPLTPRSPYAFEARWFQVVAGDGHIDAIGGARGGAHGNYRWTTWSGDTAGVSEQEQPFGVFGSYGAGDLAGLAYAGGSPVVLGAWQSERAGLDIAVWTRTGDRWARQVSTGTPLASTPNELVAARAIAPLGDGLILSGSVTRLAPGSVRVDPAVWTAPAGTGPWTRMDLPRPPGDALTEAHAATCVPRRCLVAGDSGGRLALWEVVDGSPRQLAGIPDVSLPDHATVLPPLRDGDDDVVVVPSREGAVVLRRSGTRWSVETGPRGTPTAAVLHGRELWLVTTGPSDPGTLLRVVGP